MKRILLALLLAVAAQAQVMSFVSSSSAAPAGDTRLTGLIAFWKMDETSGTRDDSIGSNDLAENGTGGVGYAAGVNGNAADLEKNDSDYLSIADNADLSFGTNDSFTLAAWYKAESSANNITAIICKSDNDGAQYYEYMLTHNSNNEFYLYGIGATKSVATSSSGSYSDNTWYCVIAWVNAATDSLYIKVNNGAITRTASANAVDDKTNTFYIGRIGTVTSTFLDGLVDDVGVWGRCPTSANGYAMADSIYNGGAGWRP